MDCTCSANESWLHVHTEIPVRRSRIKRKRIDKGAELGVLEDHDDAVEASWEDQAELEVDSAIREKRQAERERRIAEHQRRKREKEQLRTGTGNVAPTASVSGSHSSPLSPTRKVF
ncbi:hypothetical protein HPB51_007963 [Rhipicephalus microplus]|uniref:Uncharacterized protein n=1 Tax=Rhipicephalus microplus TaxID=6941 RepID=A0A9J6DU05_RHIMP|nr:hypothetical protein HPB51_007963 [Rhipicephalus microplus]